ncbi:MAG: flavodoxin family protein [Proteobacteria bacterium]|nr:flavodoxin family protein [Pseudomonadota bacterium]
MNTVILFGSPRKEGNTVQLTGIFSQTLKERGHNVRTIYLNDLNIRPCQGCLACMPVGICKINDDMKDIRKYIMESNIIVYATPIYWFSSSSQLKLVIDRSLAFLDENYGSRVKGKKAVTIITCADEDIETCRPAIDMFKKTFSLLGLDYAGSIEATGCEQKGIVKDEYKEKTKALAESIA